MNASYVGIDLLSEPTSSYCACSIRFASPTEFDNRVNIKLQEAVV